MWKKVLVLLAVFIVLGMSIRPVLADDDCQGAECPSPSPETAEKCDVLPTTNEPAVDGTYTADNVIAGTGGAATTGDLEVAGTTLEDVPAICGDVQDVIVIGAVTPFQVCSVTDSSCINAMRAEHGAPSLTDDQAKYYGEALDDVFKNSVSSNDYVPAITSFRWLTGDVVGPDPFVAGDNVVQTWLGVPDDSETIQSLAWYIGDCCSVVEPPVEQPPVNPPEKPVRVRVNTGGESEVTLIPTVLVGLVLFVSLIKNRKK